ncbi:MAG: hypothetical protein AAFX92_18565 [Pseudomonadota bacterium]
MASLATDQPDTAEHQPKRRVSGASKVAAEILAALLVVHIAFLLFIAFESPVLFNLLALLEGSISAEPQAVLVTIGSNLVDGPPIVAERVAIGLVLGLVWLVLIIWLWQRGGWLAPLLALAAGGWEVYWRISVLQLQSASGQPLSWLVVFGLLSAGVMILAGVVGLAGAATRNR